MMMSVYDRRSLITCVLVCVITPGFPSLVPQYKMQDTQQQPHNSDVSPGPSHLLYTVLEEPSSSWEGRSHGVYEGDVGRTNTRSGKCQIEGTVVDCSSRALKEIPEHLPSDITHLDLFNNSITTLPDNVFLRYPLLRHLNISSNKITAVSKLSFQKLSCLVSLDLYNNNLEMRPGVYPDDMFLPLTSLRHLNISRNNKNITNKELRYPHVALSRLTSLRELHMDGLNVDIAGPLGLGFQNLTRLTHLTLAGYYSGYCNLKGLRVNTFQNVEYLEHLDISNCRIHGDNIDSGIFSHQTRLRLLDLSLNEDIDIPNLDRVLAGLKKATKLSHLNMHLISNRYSLSVCLESKYLENFPPNLVYFDARENNLEAVDRNVIDKLTSLEQLNLSGNKFVFGAYLLDLPKLKKLKSLKINGEQTLYHLPSVYPYYLRNQSESDSSNSTCTIYVKDKLSFVLNLPPRLEHLEMNRAGLNYILSNLTVSGENCLRNLSLSDNHFPRLGGPIYGLNALKHLDLSSSFVSTISERFFQNLTTLEVLILHSNLLGPTFPRKQSARVLSPLTSLQVLDLSFNAIDSINSEAFLELRNLTTLLLARNPLIVFDVDISHMNYLQMLNLSHSHISYLPMKTQQHISKLIAEGFNVTVDLSHAQINCECINLKFLSWMTSCGAFHIEPKNYFCALSDLSIEIITDGYVNTISNLNRACISVTLLALISGSCSVLMIVVVIGGIIFRFRWNIRYMYYAAYMRYKNMSKLRENHFEFDVFVCYAEEDMQFVEKTMDEEFNKRGLKTLLHRRDFTAGEWITSNIVDAVCRSRRTVVVLTRSLMESQWCSYEIEMAKMEGVYSGRPVLVFLIMEEIPRDKLGRDLLYNIKNNTYLEYPSPPYDNEQMKVWWDKLVSDIKHETN